jgi:hypothetical protein
VKAVSSSWRTQLWLIGLGYTAVFAVSAVILLARYLQERGHPADLVAYGGMYAGGDAILGIFIVCLFMIPTVFLVWASAKFEGGYTAYAQLLVGVSLTAPLCLGLFVLGKSHMTETLASLYLCRLIASPFILIGIVFSRLVARFDRAKRLTSYALLIEGLTLGIAMALAFREAHG